MSNDICGLCGTIHKPGQNTLCNDTPPRPRPGQFMKKIRRISHVAVSFVAAAVIWMHWQRAHFYWYQNTIGIGNLPKVSAFSRQWSYEVCWGYSNFYYMVGGNKVDRDKAPIQYLFQVEELAEHKWQFPQLTGVSEIIHQHQVTDQWYWKWPRLGFTNREVHGMTNMFYEPEMVK